MKKFLSIVVLVVLALLGYARLDDGAGSNGIGGPGGTTDNPATSSPGASTPSPPERQQAHAGQLEGNGVVVKLLSDDNEGSRHQRFILRRESGQTVLVAHNVDLAPRVESLDPGDLVEFFGEFEPNSKGGVVHWTHRDPAGRHIDGWIRHEGRTYQ